jgi:gamma-glutamyl-gamma-aminobutyrate hydrolase PuuD
MKPRIGITTTPSVAEDRLLEALDRANVTGVVQAGGMPLVLPMLDPSEAEAAVSCLDGLLFSGGGDVDPASYGSLPLPEVQGIDVGRDAWELALVRAALAQGVPVLGICRGAQVINVAAGGTLVQHLPLVTDLVHCRRDQPAAPVHAVRVLEGSTLHRATGLDLLGVNSLHHQAVGAVGAGLRPVGWAEDGTIEAVEAVDGSRVLGVQWHPELLPAEPGHAALFDWLVEQARSPQAVPVLTGDPVPAVPAVGMAVPVGMAVAVAAVVTPPEPVLAAAAA